MARLLFIFLLSSVTVFGVFGQAGFLLRPDKILPTTKQWTELQSKFNAIPTDRLKLVEKELDSIISAIDCYKFIYNADTTKFLAIFVQRKDDPSYPRLTHFGQVVHRHYQPSDSNSINFYAYIFWGMKFENQWYYSYLEEYVGLPEIVGWHKVSQGGRRKQLLNEEIEKTACVLEDDLWSSLHRSDSTTFHTRYKSKYTGRSCLVLYNSDRSKILLPILYYDSKSSPWVTYYFAKTNSADTILYKWTKFPTKKINRKRGDESLEIIYDIRNFIQNWGWGIVNMISTDSFWEGNFKDKDLQQVE
jgi:hypothetical protein